MKISPITNRVGDMFSKSCFFREDWGTLNSLTEHCNALYIVNLPQIPEFIERIEKTKIVEVRTLPYHSRLQTHDRRYPILNPADANPQWIMSTGIFTFKLINDVISSFCFWFYRSIFFQQIKSGYPLHLVLTFNCLTDQKSI